MSQEDFDIDALAAYLHLLPAQVLKMANRDKLPGRKVGGQWRFARADIHHWLEERIGASNELELEEVEQVLARQQAGMNDEPVLAELLPLDAISPSLSARTRNKVITAMAELAAVTGLLWDADKMAEAVKARENLHPTALESGVALLHPRRPLASILAEPFLALGRTNGGIPFGGGNLTDLFFLICSTDDRTHLRILARLSRLLSTAGVLAELRGADDAAAMHAIISAREEALP